MSPYACDDGSEAGARIIAADIALDVGGNQNDTEAYAAAALKTKQALGADSWLLAYRMKLEDWLYLTDGQGEPVSLDGQFLKHLLDVVDEKSQVFDSPRGSWASAMAVAIGNKEDPSAILALGRNDQRFAPDESSFLKCIAELLGPIIEARQTRTRDESLRAVSEKALRRNEERLRTFFEESRDTIYMANADDVVASINNAGLRLFGTADRFEVLGRPFSRWVYSPEDRKHFLHKIQLDGFVVDHEIVLMRMDGTKLFCIETTQAVKDRDGKVIEIQGIIRDMSERIAMERDIWAMNVELAEANERLKSTHKQMVQQEKLASIGQLAAGVAHEINNPLGFLKSNHTTLHSFLNTLHEAWGKACALDPEEHEHIAADLDLDYVFNEIDSLVAESDDGFNRIMAIVKNLRSFARIDDHEPLGPYDLEKGLESTLIMARNEIKYVAEVETGFCGVPKVQAVGGSINQVLLNVLVNAAQAIAGQKNSSLGHILVRTAVNEGRVICEIEDDGPGVPDDIKERLFDPFFTTKPAGKGTGLGLSLSYDIIVNRHQGSLTVADSTMGGALFRIELPIIPDHEAGYSDTIP
ncbi:MAG: ATP-binding protein [Spirochaetota bacterium]